MLFFPRHVPGLSPPFQRSNRGDSCPFPRKKRSKSHGPWPMGAKSRTMSFPLILSFPSTPTLIPQGVCLSVKHAKAVRRSFIFTAVGMKRVLTRSSTLPCPTACAVRDEPHGSGMGWDGMGYDAVVGGV
ncbi:hypothetical protein CH063_02082 [Colletotrichum higginsianum]|uniref:Uncharacterized protein n=1 Tax=Colletotrichum higginsianum (strain IMI 349063) TaxID=759273 RepID=H1VG53_COLHI|nr:hypothetical protein CH063_02082 [Colletotrichum higginsianum]